MKVEKGKIIYGMVLLVEIILSFMPSSTLLFNLEINQLKKANWYDWIPDLLSVGVLFLGYMVLTIFYKKKSRFRKSYPIFMFIVVMFWSMVVQMK